MSGVRAWSLRAAFFAEPADVDLHHPDRRQPQLIDRVHIVPAPAGVNIDGNLADGKRHLPGCRVRHTVRRPSLRRGGDDALDDRYAHGAHVGDPHPMTMSRTCTPTRTTPASGGSVIVRLAADRTLGWPLRGIFSTFGAEAAPEIGRRPVDASDSIVHLVLWYSPAKRKSLAAPSAAAWTFTVT